MILRQLWKLLREWEGFTGPPDRKEFAKDSMNTQTEATTLVAELEELRSRLNQETENAANLREEYENECCQLTDCDDQKAVAAKHRLDVALSRIEGIKGEVAARGRQIDDLQGREAGDVRRRQAGLELERAREQLAASQAQLARLKAECAVLPERIQRAEWQFNQALRTLNEAQDRRMHLERCRSS